ncbi:MAG: gamma-glutamyl-gamma-aminobutyrate hydrolase family protein [Acidobacteriota bacterium]|nr:gamma-glutamyl-gamma-aminobutyrate hydrolase family protein [Acidobacteriota bacterium]
MSKPIIGIGGDVAHAAGTRDRAFAYTNYTESIRRAGAIPVVIAPQPENVADLVEKLDGIVLAGGEDCDPALYHEERHPSVTRTMEPNRQLSDVALAKAARERGIPTLGICLGMQVMNVSAGGSLVQDIRSHIDTEIQHESKPENRARHDVIVDNGTRLASILPEVEFNVNSSHHQAIKDLADGLRITAHAPDGIVEGLEDPRHPFYVGVQWHPEDMKGEESAEALFRAFVEAAKKYAEEKSAVAAAE